MPSFSQRQTYQRSSRASQQRPWRTEEHRLMGFKHWNKKTKRIVRKDCYLQQSYLLKWKGKPRPSPISTDRSDSRPRRQRCRRRWRDSCPGRGKEDRHRVGSSRNNGFHRGTVKQMRRRKESVLAQQTGKSLRGEWQGGHPQCPLSIRAGNTAVWTLQDTHWLRGLKARSGYFLSTGNLLHWERHQETEGGNMDNVVLIKQNKKVGVAILIYYKSFVESKLARRGK